MNDLPRQKLCEIIARYGRSLSDDPRRCEGLLRDLCGEHRREVNVLVSALKERVPADLLASSESVPHEVLLARLTKRLHDNLALSEEAARWAVESWALALGKISLAKSRIGNTEPEKQSGGTLRGNAHDDPFAQPSTGSPEEQLRQAVRAALADNKITEWEKSELQDLRRRLNLPSEVASRIFAEVKAEMTLGGSSSARPKRRGHRMLIGVVGTALLATAAAVFWVQWQATEEAQQQVALYEEKRQQIETQKAFEEEKRRQAEEARRKAEEEQRQLTLRLQQEAEARRKAEETARQIEAEKRQQEEQNSHQAEELRRQAEEEQRQLALKLQQEEEARQKAEESAHQFEVEKRQQEEESKRQAAQRETIQPFLPGLTTDVEKGQEHVRQIITYAMVEGGLNNEADIAAAKGRIEALDIRNRLNHGDRKKARPLNDRGLAYIQGWQFVEAVQVFQAAYQADPADLEIINNLGHAYMQNGNIDSAQRFLLLALVLSPSRSAAWGDLGQLYARQGNAGAAVACFANAYRFSRNTDSTRQFLQGLASNGNDREKSAAGQALQLPLMQGDTRRAATSDEETRQQRTSNFRFPLGRYEAIRETPVLEEPRRNAAVILRLRPKQKVNVVGVIGDYVRVESTSGRPPGYVYHNDVEPVRADKDTTRLEEEPRTEDPRLERVRAQDEMRKRQEAARLAEEQRREEERRQQEALRQQQELLRSGGRILQDLLHH